MATSSSKLTPAWLMSPWAKPVWMLLLALPALLVLTQAFTDQLGANPAEALTRQTGDWAMRGLILVLLIGPLRTWTGWPALLRFRRATGVAVFVYAALHMLCWAWFEQGLEVADMWDDLVKRPFILVGAITLVTMLPLALSSNNLSIRKMCGAAWKRLHRLIFLAAPLAMLHFYWMRAGKQRFTEVVIDGALIVALLLWRLGWQLVWPWVWRRRQAQLGTYSEQRKL